LGPKPQNYLITQKYKKGRGEIFGEGEASEPENWEGGGEEEESEETEASGEKTSEQSVEEKETEGESDGIGQS
jgi:hypothetical protein